MNDENCIGCGMLNNENTALAKKNARLREALKSLANESDGFLQSADAMQHGVTNMQVLWMRINEARAALEGCKDL